MKRFLSLIFLALVSCTKPKSDIIVDLSNQEGHGPFRLGQVLVFPSEDSLHFQGVPKEIKEFVVRNVVLQRLPAATENNRNLSPASKEKPQSPQTNGQEVSPPIDSEVLFLIGTKSNKRVIVVDSDNDEDFSNEEILEYEYPLPLEKQKEIRDNLPTVIIQYECLENNQKVTKKAKMRPTPYAGSLILTYNRPIKKIEKEYFLAVSFLEYKEGKIVLNDTDCSIYVSNGFTKITYPKDRVSVFVTPSGDKMPAELENDDIPYEIGDVFNVKGRDFQIDSITNFGDKLFIKDIGENTKPVGVTEGFYVPKFFAKRLDNSVFELNQFPNKFVLLDFWGTWCGPCRALIPELKKLNDEFSNKNFVMVSVAYDKDPQKVSDMVSKEQMNWEHVFVSQNDQDKNSLVDKLKISSFPTTILIGPDGKILARTEDLDKIREIVNRGLTKN